MTFYNDWTFFFFFFFCFSDSFQHFFPRPHNRLIIIEFYRFSLFSHRCTFIIHVFDRLDFVVPKTLRIHNIVSVGQLEPCPGPDPFNRTMEPPGPVLEEDGEEPEYEIEKIVGKDNQGRYINIVKWKGYGHEWVRPWMEPAGSTVAPKDIFSPKLIAEFEGRPLTSRQRERISQKHN